MEELWKKHKNDIKLHLLKINKFLDSELEETSRINEKSNEKISNEIQQIESNIVLDENLEISDEKQMKKRGRPRSKRKEVYGKLRDIVKNLMEKENLSRAQAYRRAKKIYLESK